MKFFKKAFLMPLFLAVTIVVLGLKFSTWTEGQPDQTGYFKSDGKNRVMAYVATPGMTEPQALEFLSGQMHTPGGTTHAVIYEPGASHPGDILTRAEDTLAALAILADPPFEDWKWGIAMYPTGLTKFLVDGAVKSEWHQGQ